MIKSSDTTELTWALILACRRHVVTEDRALRDGRWQTTVGTDLAGSTLGVLGLGRLGTQVARIGQAFDMRVIAWSQNLTPGQAAEAGVTWVPKDELLATSDVLTVHLKLSDRTAGLLPHLGYVTEAGYRSMHTQVVEDIAAWRAGTPIRVLTT